VSALTELHGVAKQTVRTAIETLKAEGLVENRGGRAGNVVRVRPPRRRIEARTRGVYRDEVGYYFDEAAKDWSWLRPAVVEHRPASADIAEFLGIEEGGDVLVRDRLVGVPDAVELRQASTSYLPSWLLRELPVVTQLDTGPGGIYDRIEETYGALTWREEVTSRAPSPEEARELALPAGVPVLVVTRITSTRKGRVVEVTEVRVSAERWSISYPLRRTASAHWPVVPATAQNLTPADTPADDA